MSGLIPVPVIIFQAEEERKRKEEQERKEHEEYLLLKEQFTVEEEGVGETVEEVLELLSSNTLVEVLSLKCIQFLYLSMNGIKENNYC